MSHRTRSALAVQSVPSADCRHVRAPFDQGFHVVSRRADLSSDAKVLHAFLVSLHRTGRALTQREIADELGLTRHRVWAALHELVAADLLVTVRVGLGQPNRYELVGIDALDLAGRSPESGVRPGRSRFPGSPETPRVGTYYPQRTTKERGTYIRPPRSAGDLMLSRYGRVEPRR